MLFKLWHIQVLKLDSFHSGHWGITPHQKHHASFSSLIPCYLLKVTKFLGKVSQFEFSVMSEKNIFAYKLFLSLNISDFNLFLWENWNILLKKVTPSFPATPSKSWGPVKPPHLQKGGGVPTMHFKKKKSWLLWWKPF